MAKLKKEMKIVKNNKYITTINNEKNNTSIDIYHGLDTVCKYAKDNGNIIYFDYSFDEINMIYNIINTKGE